MASAAQARRPGAPRRSGCRSSRGSTVGHSSTRPGALVRALSWVVPTAEIFEGQAPEMERLGEGPVDRREHRLRGTEGERQTHVLEAQRGALGPCLPIPAARLELARRRALEAEDRLLRIADREDGSDLPRSRAAAGREILGDVAQDLPLLGVRVLRLVDEHVVDAAVELVQHPGAVAAREQRQRLGDEIVEIERADPLLVGLDPLHDRGARAYRARSCARPRRRP